MPRSGHNQSPYQWQSRKKRQVPVTVKKGHVLTYLERCRRENCPAPGHKLVYSQEKGTLVSVYKTKKSVRAEENEEKQVSVDDCNITWDIFIWIKKISDW